MKKINLIFIIILVFSFQNLAQKNTLKLEECYESLLNTHPLSSQKQLYEQSNQLNIENLKAGWMPAASVNLQATYQSESIDVDISIMGNSVGFQGAKDQYKATVDVNQLIYDWGRIKAAKQLENSKLEINKQNTVIELNKFKEHVNKFFFAILILEKNKEMLGAMLNELEAREKTVASGVQNGILLKSDLNVIKAEIIKLKQNLLDIEFQRKAAINALSEITGLNISYSIDLKIPEIVVDYEKPLSRPELDLFSYQQSSLDQTSSLLSAQNRPTIFAFSQLGYGKPGLNMISDEFDAFYYVGVKLTWDFWDWNQTKREKQILNINKNLIQTREESFVQQVNVALKTEQTKIESLKSALQSDKEIIALREEVSRNAHSRLEHGVITATDYLIELNAETTAKINYETHKIQLVQAQVNYKYLKGKM